MNCINMQIDQYDSCRDRPDLHGILISGKRGRLFSALYTAGGKAPHPVVLLLHGIPGNEQNGDIAQALRSSGFHVLTFHYSGCFGSDGEYSLSHNIEDANTVLDYILNDTGYGFDKTRIYAVGHSMGGFVCAQLAAARPEIRGAALLMPCDIGRAWKTAEKNPAVAQKILDILVESAEWLCGANKEEFIEELQRHSDVFQLEGLAEHLSKRPLLCVEASLDTHTPPEYHCRPLENAVSALPGNRMRILQFETDHFASDCRLELANVIVSFLLSLSDPAEWHSFHLG